MLNETGAIVITSIVRFLVSLIIFKAYYKTKNAFTLYIGFFFFLFSIYGSFRILNAITGNPFWYFLHVLFLCLGTVAIMQALSAYGVKWVKKYHLVFILSIAAIAIAYFDTYVLGPQIAEKALFARVITLSMGGVGLIAAGRHFYVYGKNLVDSGRNMTSLGFTLEGLLHFAAIILLPLGFLNLAFWMGFAFTLLIGVGLWIAFSKEKTAFNSVSKK